jgi:hypothetical protein
MENTVVSYLFDDIRFLEYRLDVIGQWPESPRKRATAEAISRRLAAIGRATLGRPDVDCLLAASCRLLDHLFSANAHELVYSQLAA